MIVPGHKRVRRGAQIQMQMLVPCIKEKLVFGEISLLASLVPALNILDPTVTLYLISSLPKFNSSTSEAQMCFLFVHG